MVCVCEGWVSIWLECVCVGMGWVKGGGGGGGVVYWVWVWSVCRDGWWGGGRGAPGGWKE